jgi:hypothetical protein
MKHLLGFIACAVGLSIGFNVYAQGTSALVPRTVLVEEGTNWRCGPCAVYNPNVDQFLSAHEGSVIHLAYHPDWPGADDPMYLNDQTDNQERVATYYAITGVPSVVFDGGTPYVPGYVDQLEASFAERFSLGSPVAITVTHTMDGSNMNVHIALHPVQDMSSIKSLYLRVAAVEDWIDGPGPNGEANYVHAMREMLPTHRGKAIKLTTRDTTFDYTYEIRADYAPERMYEVAFIQSDATKEVLQAASDKSGFALQPKSGERWVERVNQQGPGGPSAAGVDFDLSNSTAQSLVFQITYEPTSSHQWPLTINDVAATEPQTMTVAPGGQIPLVLHATQGEGAYMSGRLTVKSTIDGEDHQSVFPVKFIAPDVKLALVDIGADSIRSAPVIATMDAAAYYYVPVTSGEMAVMSGWSPAEFPEIVVEGNKWIVSGSTKTSIASYIQQGGHALVHGGEIAFGLADAASTATDRDANFLHTTLRVDYVKDSAGPHTVRGVPDDVVSGPYASSSLDIYAQNTDAPNQPDEIKPYNGSLPIFYYGTGNQVAGVRWEDGHSRMVYLAFGLQNLSSADETSVLKQSIDWLRSPFSGVSEPLSRSSIDLKVYPNPASRDLSVAYSLGGGSSAKDVTISLIDATGRVLRTMSSSTNIGIAHFDVTTLAKGSYFCILRTPTSSVMRPIAIE